MTKNKHLVKLFSFIPAIALLVSCSIGSTSTDIIVEDLTYTTVSINPSIALMVNAQQQIRTAFALNGDGEMVMLQLELEGKTLQQGVTEIVDETIDLDFISEETVDPDVEVDVISNQTTLQNQTQTQLQTHLINAFTNKSIQIQTRTRTYTQTEMDEAGDKGVTPLRLELVKKAMIGHHDLLEEEALELDMRGLLNRVKQGKGNLYRIASTLGQAFLDERKAIHDLYRDDILALKEAIATAKTNGTPYEDLEQDLVDLRQEMVDAMQALISNYRQQTTTAREQWQQEAQTRKGDNSGNPEGPHAVIIS